MGHRKAWKKYFLIVSGLREEEGEGEGEGEEGRRDCMCVCVHVCT